MHKEVKNYVDERHKWGLTPMHYKEKYYKVIYNKLCDVIGRE